MLRGRHRFSLVRGISVKRIAVSNDLIAERYERTATIVTSSLDFNEWGNAFPNKLLGASTLDRLRHAAYRMVLDGKSYRSPRPMQTGKIQRRRCGQA